MLNWRSRGEADGLWLAVPIAVINSIRLAPTLGDPFHLVRMHHMSMNTLNLLRRLRGLCHLSVRLEGDQLAAGTCWPQQCPQIYLRGRLLSSNTRCVRSLTAEVTGLLPLTSDPTDTLVGPPLRWSCVATPDSRAFLPRLSTNLKGPSL